jgi:hypothetical protein
MVLKQIQFGHCIRLTNAEEKVEKGFLLQRGGQ